MSRRAPMLLRRLAPATTALALVGTLVKPAPGTSARAAVLGATPRASGDPTAPAPEADREPAMASPSAPVEGDGMSGGAEPAPLSPWQSDERGWFASGTTDLGILYFRPRVMLGWGAPHWQFVALDAYVTVTNSFASPYLGYRAALPFLDAFLGARRVYPYDRRFLPPADRHRGDDLSLDRGGERSVYDVAELELAVYLPVLHGVVYGQLHPLYVDAPRGVHLFEERIRAVMAPPFAMNTRLGYLYDFGGFTALKVGLVSEYVVVPRRPRNVLRGGPLFLLPLSPTLEVAGAFSAVLDSPDALGTFHGPYAFVGVVHRWAHRF